MTKKTDDISWLVIGWCSMIGVWTGFIFLETSPLYFLAWIMIGVGLGLVLAPIISNLRK